MRHHSFFHLGNLLQLSNSLYHLALHLLLQFGLIQVLNALQVALPFVNFAHNLVEQLVQLALQLLLWRVLFFFFLNNLNLTIGLE